MQEVAEGLDAGARGYGAHVVACHIKHLHLHVAMLLVREGVITHPHQVGERGMASFAELGGDEEAAGPEELDLCGLQVLFNLQASVDEDEGCV
jgi:hypothetical protein